MIFTDRTIVVKNGTSSIDSTIVLYRGDREVEIRFTLNEGSPFKFGSGTNSNIIEKAEATYGQLVIKTPGALPPIFSEVTPTIGGKIIFTITAEMIDETTEVGNYTFQIRLLDDNMESRATLPEVKNGIEIREPIATENVTTTNEVGEATVGYALTTAGTTEDTFDSQGNYNKTTWRTGDRITASKLNKIEAGIDGVNKKVASGGTSSTTVAAELIDARIGANGVTYNNLGTAIRKQFNAIVGDTSSSSTLTIDDSFTAKVISVDISGFKGQVVEFIISCDHSILPDNFGIPIGITKPDGTNINAICTVTPNKTFRLKLDYNIIKINAWIDGKPGNGDVVLTASIKNIFDYVYELDNKISKPNRLPNHLQGLSFSILGDSYCTYKGWIPSGNASWYSDTGNSTPENDVAGVADTWWYKLSKDSGMSLLVNDSYSGSTVSTTGYNGDDYTSFCFTTRMVNALGEKRALEPKPNIIFIFGGINDNVANSPIGELKYSDWSSNDLKSFLPAFCYMIAYIKKYNPQARIINIIDTDLKSEITNGMVSACEYYSIENIVLSNISKTGWHPNKEGMEAIKNQIISIL